MKKQSFKHIESALKDGCMMHCFRSGGGLRIVRLEKRNSLKGYGEHPNIMQAFKHANEDYKAGGREYSKVYGKKYPHYITGTHSVDSQIDEWILGGHTMDAFFKENLFVVELEGYHHTKIPKDVYNRVFETGKTEHWKDRGFTYCSELSRFPNGTACVSTSMINQEEGCGEKDAWMYKVTMEGASDTFLGAINEAFKSEKIEKQ